MVRRNSSAALVAGLALLTAAGVAAPASAALYTFDVTLQGASFCTLSACGNVSGFAPFTFRQTWDIEAASGGFSLNQITNGYAASGPGAITPGAADPSLLTLLGLGPAAQGEIDVQRSLAGGYPGDPVYDDKNAWLSASSASEPGLAGNVWTSSGFGFWLYGSGGGPASGLTTDQFAAALAGAGPLTFLADAYRLSSDARTYATISYGQIDVWGEATYRPPVLAASPPEVGVSELSAAVPEPSTWLLLIAGFGLTGATLRRRTAAAKRLPVRVGPPQAAK